MNIIKKNIKQTTKIARLLLFSIGLLMSFNSFAAPGGLPEDVAALQEQINNITPSVYAIGDILDDGSIVFYVDDSGEHGLAAWPEDEEDNIDWFEAVEATDARGFGFHLPTKAELRLLRLAQDTVGGFIDSDYWSLTEESNDSALVVSFIESGEGSVPKTSVRSSRAVKTF